MNWETFISGMIFGYINGTAINELWARPLIERYVKKKERS